jgi:uncharacterized repeat protein (TIGR03803 family)
MWDAGTVYRMKADGTVSTLHEFRNSGLDAGDPGPGLIQAGNGGLYGVHRHDGEFGAGMVFRIGHRGAFEIVHSFEGGRAGNAPASPLIQASDGHFYGTTFEGGVDNQGTVFRLKPGGGFKVLHSFRGGASHPAHPIGGLLEGRDGFLYGTTYHGGNHFGWGDYGTGTVFKMDRDGVMVTVHQMPQRGRNPAASLIQTRDGEIFGTSRNGGPHGTGSAFRLTEEGRLEWLHVFERNVDGEWPNGILEASDGQLYITMNHGLGFAQGAVVRMASDGQTEVVHVYDYPYGGVNPLASLIEDNAGRLIGTTRDSGQLHGYGTIFALTRI